MSSGRRRTAVLAATVMVAAGVAPPSNAAVDPALNGVFTATSDGQWSTKNGIRWNEATVVSTWTIESSCTNAYTCTGTVTSDHGWSAETKYIAQMWFVTRDLNDWVPCPDGSFAPGRQIIKFHEHPNQHDRYVGWDTATGPSGACGINLPLFIEMPFTLVPK